MWYDNTVTSGGEQMPSDASNTIQEIMRSAKEEFLAHGFADASLRRIASGAGVTTGALYRHFRNKEELFTSLVEPAYSGFCRQYQEWNDAYFSSLDENGVDIMWDESNRAFDALICFIYDHFDAFKLLISASEKTVYETFTHRLIQLDVDMTMDFIGRAQKAGRKIRSFDESEIHMLCSAQYSAIYEMILHDFPREQAIRYAGTLWEFFSSGWRSLFREENQT